MIGHGGGVFQRATVSEIRGDTRGPKRVVADPSGQTGRRRAALDHRERVPLHHDGASKPANAAALPGAARDDAKQRPLS
jgi:hypothetical protein